LWGFIIGSLRLVTDREIYMLVWLTIRDRFNNPANNHSASEPLVQPKSKAARRGSL
jgi:hypothetical protein